MGRYEKIIRIIQRTCFTALILSALYGCAINSISKTASLKPGMTASEVRGILGNPESSEHYNGYTIWKYHLQKIWVGYIPHYLAFDKEHRLVMWKADMNEYYSNQQLWIKALPKQHDVHIKGNINHQINGVIDIQ